MKFRVRELRMAKGMSMDELAARSGVSRGTIVHIECHQNAIVMSDTLLAIAKALGVKVDDILAE